MGDDVSIRTASDEDVQKLVEDRHDRHHLLEHLRTGRGIVLFALLGEALVGHVFLRLGPPEEPELLEGLPDVPLLQHLRVMTSYQRTGIARRLLREAEQRLRARNHRRVALGVHPDNEVAISLYLSERFTAWRTEPIDTFRLDITDDGQHVHVSEPCLVFVKELD
ncbi:GNAT family N-acetyltransferase [Actinoplanes utahensis]|uniref:N-acetyltransferase domain-containing protein n=1 Tax=Actinoplanes utahensis TaxID=1869 RepID=A0A0A6X6N8_ACTUT|nr:GNAT family N-acetyltransferase [Actinoplanes utahensis]KHD75767.1 hypothetical protein MB27_21405 [Actinoplanes utahensis]GIF34467.1 hypothetical protein Aut01nite_74530 [Actinoplanes utahensis]